ncbi:MAG: glycosyltransferase family 39 protein [Bryobacteraceae bacterium]
MTTLKHASASSAISRNSETALALTALALLSAAFVAVTCANGWTLWYGDAQAHVNIARRVIDSRTPGIYQIGTVWLPLPHALMLPLVRNDWLWRTGLAGAIPAAACFVVAGAFLFATVRRVFASSAAAWASLAAFAFNPNLLYLQATPMTEPMFFAAMAVLLYATVRFAESDSSGWAAVAGVAGLAASLTRYEGWFLLPFAAAFVLGSAKSRGFRKAALFSAIACAGPLYWLAHNLYFWGKALEFYNGPWSAQAIYERGLGAGLSRYPGDHNWATAALYFRTAAVNVAGLTPLVIAAPGLLVVLWRRAWWPLWFLALTPLFYLWSMHSGSVPIYVPSLWPHSYYNTRYALALLPLLAFAAGATVLLVPRVPLRGIAALAVAIAALTPWLLHPRPDNWACWKESQVNSAARRAWTEEAAGVLARDYHGGGILAGFGDLTGIFARAGIPLRETLHEGNVPAWDGALARPDLMLHEEWAVAVKGDSVFRAIGASPRYALVRAINVPGAPTVYIWRRN